MSNFGLQTFNGVNELTVSSNANLLHCLGRPTLLSLTQPSGRADQGRPNPKRCGNSLYRINSRGPFLIAMDLPLNRNVGVVSINEISSGVWDIEMFCGALGDADGFDTVQYPIDIWAFGFTEALAGSWGMALYNSSERLAADFSQPYPLWPRAVVDAYGSPTLALPSLTRPVVVGMPTRFSMFTRPRDTGLLYDYIDQMDFWCRTSNTALKTVSRKLLQYTINDPEDPENNADGPGPSIIIEGALLP